MTVILDTIFFIVFTLTSLLWMVPFLGVIFAPFLVMRLIKKRTAKLAQKTGLKEVYHLPRDFQLPKKKFLKTIRYIESKGKWVYANLSETALKKSLRWQRFEAIEAVPLGAKVLDIGSGPGYLAKKIQVERKAEVTCTDVVDFNRTDLPTVLFDGLNLPFADREFDVVLLSYVLHHAGKDQEKLLAEAKRVCRGKIIIYEDEVLRGSEKLYGKAHGGVYNWLYGTTTPCKIRPTKEWLRIFKANGLEVEEKRSDWGVGSILIPVKKAFFVLRT
ncbi:MAG TPA: class I SAM-dependent methyltransferase [Candidatus Bathyarchaeia archaeon]|nr:class I SAM-dependent methyltransferase [Candidatus Bathyarchaeia archaeon]